MFDLFELLKRINIPKENLFLKLFLIVYYIEINE